MKLLKDLLYKVSIESVNGNTAVPVNTVHFDSRKVSLDDVFVAVRGTQADGHQFMNKAVDQGAIAVVCEELPEQLVNGVTYVRVADSKAALAIMASNFFGNPSANLKLVGVTGTNGKTTVTTLLYQLFRKAGYKVGLLSTVKVMVDLAEHPATHTTPDPMAINRYLSMMNEAGVEFAFMEVSSHGIHQKRTEGLQFRGGVFTNLSHDHLDYHKTFAEYRDVKKSFFDHLPKSAFALTNKDDKNGAVMLQNTKAEIHGYALRTVADFKAQILENQLGGLLLKIEDHEVWTRLIGDFNAYNLLAVYATATLLGLEKIEVLKYLSELESVGGRFEYVESSGGITAIVDYAHTPDALKNVLGTINDIRTGNENLITVVGCGGDRDTTKRPVMGNIATALSDRVLFTSDNPRSENPEEIIKDMEKGVEPQHTKKLLSITDRRQAIRTACQLAERGDIILIAGKGHETYQEIKGKRYDFDDLQVVKELLKELEK
ncbi:UDP-N-acetylmuramoyl-L-alanyl-D-glutamate--2,6-diaminopimelate ligase [Robertkochia aurantiaca]|uniref:UDP-N-acetylmuramoyl-L-alanyl-D-glutamate--2, 6-diaminopimelate ligase n=1 Tax=Robertkochia aurantiaca TaxID=2873700 RepID=UPI001CD0380E|nr:UDP-N-acetylmuramoyl-L-alanyl-D-glutamate--2,6-diaminopimelate ligase [Robertkochia sp. 3YJGBD-33]